jgi:hypothetical protein
MVILKEMSHIALTRFNVIIAANGSLNRPYFSTKTSACGTTYSAHKAAVKSSRSAPRHMKATGIARMTPLREIHLRAVENTTRYTTPSRHVHHAVLISPQYPLSLTTRQPRVQESLSYAGFATSKCLRKVIPTSPQMPNCSCPVSHLMSSLMAAGQPSVICVIKLLDSATWTHT